ncbi:MAG: EamA family transporter [Alphaproteobacteria bacterium]|nr:EamA family transporter [Alphaproteobacteria bacterium]
MKLKLPALQALQKAIFLSATSVFFIVLMNAFAKVVTTEQSVISAIFYRALVGLFLTAGIMMLVHKKLVIKTTRMKDHIIRCFVGNIGLSLIFWAYSLMPMADVTAIMFLAPIIVTVLSIFILKEQVKATRWIAVIAGLIGVSIVIGPRLDMGWSALGVGVTLAATVTVSLVAVMVRELGKTEDPLMSVLFFFFFGACFTFPFMLFWGEGLTNDMLLPLVTASGAAVVAQIAKTEAATIAEASQLGPIQYTAIIWSTLFGFLLFQETPAPTTFIGAGIIIAANIYLLWAERDKKLKKLEAEAVPTQLL